MRALAAASLPVLLATVIACGARPDPGAPANQPGTAPEPPLTPRPEAVDLAKGPARFGDVFVYLVKSYVGKVPLRRLGEDGTSADDLFAVELRVANGHATRKVDYRGWAGNDFGASHATLRDEFGNTYRRMAFGLTTRAVGQVVGEKVIQPESDLADVLIFQTPVAKASRLTLTLPGRNVGGAGEINALVPRSFP